MTHMEVIVRHRVVDSEVKQSPDLYTVPAANTTH